MEKVLVGMSGGIDSSVVALLLKEREYEVLGVTMTVWKPDLPFTGDPSKNSCFSANKKEDIEKTKEICRKIGIEHRVVDCSDLYASVVLQNFKSEYLNGRTPNPCVWCNQKVKFGAMVDFVRQNGVDFDFFATGHYARIEKQGERFALKTGLDKHKDQSYFLYRLNQEQLSSTLFPLGSMTKEEVRAIDFEHGFHPANQSESQDFYSGHYTELLQVEEKTGNIVTVEGKVLGQHKGMWNYTIGQRKGLGIAAEKPLYVIELRPDTNEVVVGFEESTHYSSVEASQLNWVSIPNIQGEIRAQAKIRSTSKAEPCTARLNSNGGLEAIFDRPVLAATPGQSLVLYDQDTVLCGGIIEKTCPVV